MLAGAALIVALTGPLWVPGMLAKLNFQAASDRIAEQNRQDITQLEQAARAAEQRVKAAEAAALQAFADKLATLGEFAPRLLSLVMLNVLDEKWKDHLYDLDQLRNAIHYRSWGQKDPLIEYKQEAYTMFVDLMHDVHHTFAERFLRVQVQFDAPAPGEAEGRAFIRPNERAALPPAGTASYATVDEFGVMADPVTGEPEPAVGPTRPEPAIVGAGRGVRSLAAGAAAGPADFANVGRNDPCPCGSGKKFKKCHGSEV